MHDSTLFVSILWSNQLQANPLRSRAQSNKIVNTFALKDIRGHGHVAKIVLFVSQVYLLLATSVGRSYIFVYM